MSPHCWHTLFQLRGDNRPWPKAKRLHRSKAISFLGRLERLGPGAVGRRQQVEVQERRRKRETRANHLATEQGWRILR